MNNSERGPPPFPLCNRLYHMDCMELFPLIPDGSVSLILTDPPYGISYQNCYSHKKHRKLEGDTGIDYERFAWELCQQRRVGDFLSESRRLFQRTSLKMNSHQGQIYGKRKPVERYNACWFGEEYPKSTYNSAWLRKQGLCHPTVKNVEFLSWLIQISSLPGELVFDGFMGLGSTALAAIQTRRDYLGAEIDRGYFEVARDRIMAAACQNTERG